MGSLLHLRIMMVSGGRFMIIIGRALYYSPFMYNTSVRVYYCMFITVRLIASLWRYLVIKMCTQYSVLISIE